jgi:hypothetical protein
MLEALFIAQPQELLFILELLENFRETKIFLSLMALRE